jgi:hypothetical protein
MSTGETMPANPYIFELVGPRQYNSYDVQKAFEEALGKKVTMKPVETADLDEFYGYVFPPATAKEFAEMNRSFLPGGIIEKDPKPTAAVKKTGQVELLDVFKQLVAQ